MQTAAPKPDRIQRRLADRARALLAQAQCEPLREDVSFLVLCCRPIPVTAHEWTLRRYTETWWRAVGESDAPEHQRQNVGRRSANTWLRQVLITKGMPLPSGEEIKEFKV